MNDIGWQQIRTNHPDATFLPRWVIAYFDGEHWFIPGIAGPQGRHVTHVGPKLTDVVVEFE